MPIPFLIALLGSAATAAGSAAAAAGAAAAGAAAAAGTAALALGGAALAAITSAPVLYIGAGVLALGGIGSMLEDAEREGHAKGFKHGYRKGCIDTARKFSETVEQHTARVCGMYALGFYMAFIDGDFDEDDAAVIVEVLGSRKMQPDYVQAKLDTVVNMKKLDMKVITEKYLNKINKEELKDCDTIIKEFVAAFRRSGSDVSSFYTKIWKPYYNDRV